jgi:hypothetical protein
MSTITTTSPARWFFGIFAALAVFVIVGIYSSRMAYDTTGYDEDQAAARKAKLEKLQAADQKTLTTAGWVDQDKGVIRIPIDEAMTQEVETLNTKPVQAGQEIPGTVPATTGTVPAGNAIAPSGAKAPVSANPPSAKAPAAKTSTAAPNPRTSAKTSQ